MSCVVPEKKSVIVTQRAATVITQTPPSDVVAKPDHSFTVVTQPKVTHVASSPRIPVVESCQIRFIRQDPQQPAASAAIVADILSDDWVEVDSFDHSLSGSFTWKVQSDDPALGSRVACFVSATHNGIGSAQPSQVKWTTFGKVRFGEGAFLCEVRILPAGASVRMGLFVKVPTGSRVTVWRIQALG